MNEHPGMLTARLEHQMKMLRVLLHLIHEQADVSWAEGYELLPSLAAGKVGFRIEVDSKVFWQRWSALAKARGWRP